jgi:hypothetical protein
LLLSVTRRPHCQQGDDTEKNKRAHDALTAVQTSSSAEERAPTLRGLTPEL